MNNIFSDEFPSELHGKLAPEEFQETIMKVNKQLKHSMPANLKWLLCGFICCCCTLGCSMWPSICINRKVKRDIEKTLEVENSRLYCTLGLYWSLTKQRSSEPVVLMEYVCFCIMHSFLQCFVGRPYLYALSLCLIQSQTHAYKFHVNNI